MKNLTKKIIKLRDKTTREDNKKSNKMRAAFNQLIALTLEYDKDNETQI